MKRTCCAGGVGSHHRWRKGASNRRGLGAHGGSGRHGGAGGSGAEPGGHGGAGFEHVAGEHLRCGR